MEVAVEDRESWLARTIVDLVDTLVADFDLIDFLGKLASRCEELVEGAEVGLLLRGQLGNLQPMYSSNERMRAIAAFDGQHHEGPSVECADTGRAVLNRSLDDADDHWPLFAALARSLGYRTVSAFPLRYRDNVIGVMTLLDGGRTVLDDQTARLVQALADAATIGLLQEQSVRLASELADQLQTVLEARASIEQARGMVSDALNLSLDEATVLLRDHARAQNVKIVAVAGWVVSGELNPADLLSPAEESVDQPGTGQPDGEA